MSSFLNMYSMEDSTTLAQAAAVLTHIAHGSAIVLVHSSKDACIAGIRGEALLHCLQTMRIRRRWRERAWRTLLQGRSACCPAPCPRHVQRRSL